MLRSVCSRAGIAEEMLQHVRRDSRIECCGLLAGRDGVIERVFPAKNILASATAYEIAPQELFTLFRQMRSDGMDLMGIYHSHPSGENVPSPRDIVQAFYPASAYFILSPQEGAANPVRVFSIVEGAVQELTIEVVPK